MNRASTSCRKTSSGLVYILLKYLKEMIVRRNRKTFQKNNCRTFPNLTRTINYKPTDLNRSMNHKEEYMKVHPNKIVQNQEYTENLKISLRKKH